MYRRQVSEDWSKLKTSFSEEHRHCQSVFNALTNLIQIFGVSCDVREVREFQMEGAKLRQDGATARRPSPVATSSAEKRTKEHMWLMPWIFQNIPGIIVLNTILYHADLSMQQNQYYNLILNFLTDYIIVLAIVIADKKHNWCTNESLMESTGVLLE